MANLTIHYLTLPDGYNGGLLVLPHCGEVQADDTVRLETADGLLRWAHVGETCTVCRRPVYDHIGLASTLARVEEGQ